MKLFKNSIWLLLACFGCADLRARVLDNFNDNVKTAWKDFTFLPGAGAITESGGQFHIDVPALGQPLFAASTLTSETLVLTNGRTIEIRVDMVRGNGKDSFAILSWIPASNPVSSLAGYSIAKSETDILVVKGLNKYFYNENPTPALKNENVVLSLSLTGSGNNVIITARVLDKDNNLAVIFEKTFVDTPSADVLSDGKDEPAAPFLGAGNFVLMGYADFAAGGPSTYSVVFDNAEAWITDQTVLDDFNDNTKTDWKEFTFLPGAGKVRETGGQFQIDVPAIGQPLFAAATKTSKTFDVVDGERLTLQVDMISGVGKDSFAILSWIPAANPVSSLAGYSMAKSETDILVVKGLNKYFYNENPVPPLKNERVTLILTLTGSGRNVLIDAKVLDKDANNAVIFQKSFVDTPAADVLADGKDDPAAPFFGKGNFVLMCYADFAAGGPDPYSVVFDNALVAAPPVTGNVPPVIAESQPAEFANFLPSSTSVSFRVADDKPLPDSGLSLTLNGVRRGVTNGLILSGPATNRTATFTGLEAGVNYRALVQVVDSDGATNGMAIDFDTFPEEGVASRTLVIEVEDYNFGGGRFIDRPSVESGASPSTSYRDQAGIRGVDYSDTRSDGNFPYRAGEPVGTKPTLDTVRKKFAAAGGADAGVFDYDVGEIRAGEFLNYTRTFPAGNYEVYLRESLFNISQAEAVLERVTGPANVPGQTTAILGSFLGTSSGTKLRTVALTDGLGKSKVVVRLAGVETLRLRQVTPDPADGNIYQNYLVFIPVEGAERQRATVAQVSPADGANVETTDLRLSVTLKDRDTQVRGGSIQLLVNDAAVTPQITSSPEGTQVAYRFPTLPATGSRLRARIVFADTDNVFLTNDWSFIVNYRSLDAAHARQGAGRNPGFNVRVVQAPQGSGLENSLLRAEEQLGATSKIPAYFSTNAIVPQINFSQNGPDSADGTFPEDAAIPGLVVDENGSDDIAMEITAYLQLPSGTVRMGAHCDDGYQIVSGAGFGDLQAPPVGYHNGGPANETFEFVVPVAGLYPFRMVWYERGGGAHVEWFSVDPRTGERVLINDSKAGAIKAFAEAPAGARIVVESAAALGGGFSAEPGAVLVNESSQTITLSRTGPARFFRLRYNGASAKPRLEVTSISIAGETLALKYLLSE